MDPALAAQLNACVAALPCPPLPIETNSDRVGCSFDLIAHFLLLAMTTPDPVMHERRRRRQTEIEARLQSDLKGCTSAAEAYVHFQRYTAEYICAYADDGNIGVRFMPMDYVRSGDMVHTVCAAWSGGQDTLSRRTEGARTGKEYVTETYTNLIQAALARSRLQ